MLNKSFVTIIIFFQIVIVDGVFSSPALPNDCSKDFFCLVKKLYSVYGEPNENSEITIKGNLYSESVNKLNEYFTNKMSGLIHNDFLCSQNTGEICEIDFDLLYDSQDPEPRNVRYTLKNMKLVVVCFNDQIKDETCISFIGEDENGVIKISNIIYADGR